jgi:hypothetical protein
MSSTRLSSSLIGILAAVALLWPASALAETFTLPYAGTFMYAKTNPGTPAEVTRIVLMRASDSQCFFYQVPQPPVIIRGTSGSDAYVEQRATLSGGVWTYPTFCGVQVQSRHPSGFEVHLGGGSDSAFVQNASNTLIVRGGDGDDLLVYTGTSGDHAGPKLYGEGGNDTLYSGWYMGGGSGNDTLCTPDPTAWVYSVAGGTGTDTFCGYGASFDQEVENFQTNACPAVCEGLFGW